MKIKLTLCNHDEKGDIPLFEPTSKEEFNKMIEAFLYGKEDRKTVFVCFDSYSDYEDVEYTNEHSRFLITKFSEDIFVGEMSYLEYEYFDNINQDFKLNYNIFEFENYEEAFKYCIDLKEGL